jgi:hypothetical protein
MAARTAGLAAEGGVEDVVGEAVSVPKVASGAAPEAREPGDAARPEGEARAQQNGGGRPAPEAASHHERVERTERESEPTYAVTERPVTPPEIKVESDSKEESVPPRRGWWQR